MEMLPSKISSPFLSAVCYRTVYCGFYCRKAKLVIEIDGSQHFMKDGAAHDYRRTVFMKQFGILVLRFMNKEILTNLSGVCEYIDYVVKQRLKELRSSQSQELYL